MDDCQFGRARSRDDYRNGYGYDPGANPASWGYCDGWTAAAEEAEATHGHALACHLSWAGGGVAAHERQQTTHTDKTAVTQP
jgi:hypothetical protein